MISLDLLQKKDNNASQFVFYLFGNGTIQNYLMLAFHVTSYSTSEESFLSSTYGAILQYLAFTDIIIDGLY